MKLSPLERARALRLLEERNRLFPIDPARVHFRYIGICSAVRHGRYDPVGCAAWIKRMHAHNVVSYRFKNKGRNRKDQGRRVG